MKRKAAFAAAILAIAAMSFSACDNINNDVYGPPQENFNYDPSDDIAQGAYGPPPDDFKDDYNPSENVTVGVYGSPDVKLEQEESYQITSKTVDLDNSEIEFEKGFDIEAYSGQNIYSVKEDENGGFVLCKNGEEICGYDFDLGFAPDLVIDNLYFSLKGIADESGTMNINLTVRSLLTGEEKTVYSAPLTNYRSYLYRLGNWEVMFSYNGIENDVKYEYTGVYDFVNDKCEIISKHEESVWDDSPDTAQEITAASAYDGKIYFAKEQRINGSTAVFLTCLDNLGSVLYEDRIECLDKYACDGVNIQYIDVVEDYIFVSYYSNGDTDTPKPVVLRKTEDGYSEISSGEINFCKRRISENLIDDMFVLFAAAPDENGEYSADIIAYNVFFDYALKIKFGTDNSLRFNTFADGEGNLLAYCIDGGGEYHYYKIDYRQWAE